jgi:hypothetical protein
VARRLRVAQLDGLEEDVWVRLEAGFEELSFDLAPELAAVHLWQLERREEVAQEQAEELRIRLDELGRVHVADRAQDDVVLTHGGVRTLEGARAHEHAAKGAHAVVVVVLLRELLLHERVERHGLLRKGAAVLEALRLEHDFGDESEVRLHHGHGAEERLKVVGELGAARVAGVHRDEDTAAQRGTQGRGVVQRRAAFGDAECRESGQPLLTHPHCQLHLIILSMKMNCVLRPLMASMIAMICRREEGICVKASQGFELSSTSGGSLPCLLRDNREHLNLNAVELHRKKWKERWRCAFVM